MSRERDALDDRIDEFIAEVDKVNGHVLDVVAHALVLHGGELAYVGSTLLDEYRPFAENPLARLRLRRWCRKTAAVDADDLAARLRRAEPPWPALGRALAAAVDVRGAL